MPWNDDYRVGVELIDSQHRALFRQVDELRRVHQEALGRRRFKDQLANFTSFVGEHFRCEEAWMKEHDVDGWQEHEAEHRFLMDQVTRALATFEERGPGANHEVIEYLESWLVDHVMGPDQGLRNA